MTTNVNAYKLEHGGHVHPPVLALIILPSTKGEGQNISFELSFVKCEYLYQHAINSIIPCWYFTVINNPLGFQVEFTYIFEIPTLQLEFELLKLYRIISYGHLNLFHLSM